MKKIFLFVAALVMVVAMATPAFAATPALKTPSIPDTSKIKISVKIDLPQSVFAKWFAEHPIIF